MKPSTERHSLSSIPHKMVITGLIATMLTGCSLFTKDNTKHVSPLPQFTTTLKVKSDWCNSRSDGTRTYHLRLNPAMANQHIFIADYMGHVTSVNQKNGRTQWRIQTGSHLTSGIAVNDQWIFVGNDQGELMALTQQNGKELWRTNVGSQILAAPRIADKTILVKTIDGTLTALSVADGRQLWKYAESVPALILHAESQPQTAGRWVAVGFSSGKLGVFQLPRGNLVWMKPMAQPRGTTAIEQMVDIDVTPLIINGVVYVATYQGNLSALDLSTGKLIWQHPISSYTGMTADLKTLYLSDENGDVWAFDEESGATLWKQTLLEGRTLNAPILVNNYLMVGDRFGFLHWMSKDDGHFVAEVKFDNSGIVATPIAQDNHVYVYTQEGNLYSLSY